jgi:ribosomal protein L21E
MRIITRSLPDKPGRKDGLVPGQMAGFAASQSGDRVATHCDGSCLAAVGDPRFSDDIGDVESHGGRACHKLLRYLEITLSLCVHGGGLCWTICSTKFSELALSLATAA